MSEPRVSGYDPAAGICWQFHNTGDQSWRCKCPVHTAKNVKREWALFGRCRSGRRWFWSAHVSFGKHEAHGWADTEESAMAAAMAAVRSFNTIGSLMIAHRCHGAASDTLKEIGKARGVT
jgi:hypothetical protein